MASMMAMAQLVHDPVEERKVNESTPNEQPKHEHLVIEKFYKCQWTLCDRVFVGLEDLLNHALDVHGFDEKDGKDSDKVSVITLKEEDEESIEQVNPIESTLSEIVSVSQSCATSHDHAYSHQIDHLPSAPLNESASLICSFAECVDLTFNHRPSLLRHTRLKHSQTLHPINCKPFSNVRRPTQSNHVLKSASISRFKCLLCDEWFEFIQIHIIQQHMVMEVEVTGGFGECTRTLDSDKELEIFYFRKSNSTLEHTNFTLIPPITLSRPTTSKRTSQFKKFRTHEDITLHYSSSVSKEFKFPCEECKKIRNRNYPLAFLMSHLRTYHGINLDQLNSHGFNSFTSQPQASASLDQFSANLDQSSHCLNQFNINPNFISKPMNLSMISSNSTSQSNLDVDDQQFGNDEELSVNGLNGMTNSASILTTTIEINKEYHEEVITLQDNEDSSLHLSPTLSQPSSQSQHQNIIQESKHYEEVDDDGEFSDDNWDVEVKSIVRPAFEIIDKDVEERGEMMDSDKNEEQGKEHDRDTLATGNNLSDLSVVNSQMDVSADDYHIGNDEELLMDDQVSDDNEDSDHGVDQLNGLMNGQMESDKGSDDHSEGPLIIDEDATEVDENMDEDDQHVFEHCGAELEMQFTLNRPMRMQTGIESVPTQSYPNNTIPVFSRKSYPKEHQVTQLKNDEVGAVVEEYDGNGQHGDDQLKRSNIDETENANEVHFSKIVPSGQVVMSDKTPTGKHVCEYCDKVFTYPSFLIIHTRIHTGEKPYKCPFDNCNKTFSRKSTMNLHYKSHTGQLRHVCEHCPIRFRSLSELIIHTRIHTGEKPYKCPFDNCNKTFSRKFNMKTHHMSHTRQFPHVCAQCTKSFKTPGELQMHIRTHPGDRPFKCPLASCNMTFSQKTSLRRHHMLHTGVRPHVCNQCGKGCTTKQNLKSHIRIHTGEKPFKCIWKDCEKVFSNNVSLSTHIRYKHTHERPFKCLHNNCNKTFVSKSHLERHLKTNHVLQANSTS